MDKPKSNDNLATAAETSEIPQSIFLQENWKQMFTPEKSILHAILLFLFFVWWDMFGYWILPLAIYVALLMLPYQIGRWSWEMQMQVRSVVIIYFSLLSAPLLTLWILLRCRWSAVLALSCYVGWFSLLDDAPKSGKRFVRTLRQRSFWKHFASYFPIKLKRTVELEPSRNYLFGYHPHGIISVGALCNFATEATGFAQLFPGIDLRLLTLEMNFRIPFFREYLIGMGINDASKQSCLRNLSRGPGASVMLVVGGARESLETKPGHVDLVLQNRKGFVKVALRTGASLVPVVSFGENDVFGVFHNDKAMMWQLKMQKRLGFAVPFFFGRALSGGVLHRLFGFNVGVMPLRVPVYSVVGHPIHVEKAENPTNDQINEVHAKYVAELQRIYAEFKDNYENERDEALNTNDPHKQESLKMLKTSAFKLDDYELQELSMVD